MISLREFADWMKFSVSAHNSQPFQIGQSGNTFQIWGDPKRLLPVADPHFKDLFTSLGALYETLNSFASARSAKLDILTRQQELNLEKPLLEFEVTEHRQMGFVNLSLYEKRFSYRGSFSEKLQVSHQSIITDNGFLFGEKEKVKAMATLFDQVNFEAMISSGYIEELYKWLRFERSHPLWAKDGLNAEAMALKGLEKWGASHVLQPKLFHFLNSLGLAKFLIQESSKIISARGLWVIWAPRTYDAFECGRIFQREWVNVTGYQLFGAPLSVLTDREDKATEVRGILGLSEDQKLVNVLRIGFLDPRYSRYKPSRKISEENIRN